MSASRRRHRMSRPRKTDRPTKFIGVLPDESGPGFCYSNCLRQHGHPELIMSCRPTWAAEEGWALSHGDVAYLVQAIAHEVREGRRLELGESWVEKADGGRTTLVFTVEEIADDEQHVLPLMLPADVPVVQLKFRAEVTDPRSDSVAATPPEEHPGSAIQRGEV